MPQPRPVEAAHHPGQPRELDRLPDGESGEHGKHAEHHHGRVGVLLQRVVGFANRRLLSEKEIVLHHRPDAGDITVGEQNLAVVSAEKFVPEIDQSGRDIDPHEGEVPLQSSTQPAADGERFRPVQKIFLRNLGAEAGEGAEDLQAAAHHDEE